MDIEKSATSIRLTVGVEQGMLVVVAVLELNEPGGVRVVTCEQVSCENRRHYGQRVHGRRQHDLQLCTHAQ